MTTTTRRTTMTTTTRKFVTTRRTVDHDSSDDESTSSTLSTKNNNKINKNKSVTFCFNKNTIHTIPRITNEEWPLLFYEQDELAEFRYQAFHEEILLEQQGGRL